MKIEIEIDDLSLFAKALNNACAAYGDMVFGVMIGCEIPTKFKKLKDIPFDELQSRFDCLKDVHKQVECLENLQTKEETKTNGRKIYSKQELEECLEPIAKKLKREDTTLTNGEDVVQVTLPWLDDSYDCLEVYIVRDKKGNIRMEVD